MASCRNENQLDEFYKLYALNKLKSLETSNLFEGDTLVKKLFLSFNQFNYEDSIGNLNSFSKIKNLYENLEYNSALDSIKALSSELDVKKLENKLLVEEVNYIKNKIYIFNKEYDNVELEDNFDVKLETLHFYEKYIILNQWYIQALLHSKRDETFEAFSLIHMALYQIINDKDFSDLELIFGKFKALKAEMIIQENAEYYELGVSLSKEAINLFNKHHDIASELIAWCNLASIYDVMKDSTSLRNCILKIKEISPTSKLGLFYKYNYLLAIESDKSNVEVQVYLNKFEKLIKPDECSYFYFLVQERKFVYSHLYRREDYLDEIVMNRNCGQLPHLLSKYYVLNDKILYHDDKLNPQQTVNWLIERRDIASILFVNKETFHLDDFYTTNAVEIIKIFFRHPELLNKIDNKELIIKLFCETKGRELAIDDYFNKYEIKLGKLPKIIEKINSILTRVNDFKVSKLNIPAYDSLYQYFLLKNDAMKSVNYNFNFDTGTVMKMLDKTKSKTLIDFLYSQTDSTYYFYLVKEGKLDIGQVSQREIENLSKLRSPISELKCKNQYFDFSRLVNKIKDTDAIYLIPDNQISFLPFELIESLFGRIKMYNSAMNFCNDRTLILRKDSSSLFSYSSTQTLKNREELLMPELKYGWEEISYIKQCLHSKVIAGYDFTRENFNSEFQNSILHISSHAFSGKNRQECFFYVRKQEALEKYYGYELLKFNKTPVFVNLSACNTAKGKQIIGQGIYSLSRYFFQAGSSSVVKTLWPVSDKSANQFNIAFYGHMLNGCSLHESMVATRTELRNKKSIDNDWAAFALEGFHEVYFY